MFSVSVLEKKKHNSFHIYCERGGQKKKKRNSWSNLEQRKLDKIFKIVKITKNGECQRGRCLLSW